MSSDARIEVQWLGWRIKYVPHDMIEDYNATYNVEHEGKSVVAEAARELRIPTNEIWISELWRAYEEYILYHEVREIKHRAAGSSPEEAHAKALKDERSRWMDDPTYREFMHRLRAMDRETALRKAGDDFVGDGT